MTQAIKAAPANNPPTSTRHHAHWINDQLICDCGSRTFTIFREAVARKFRTRNSRRRRRVAVCDNNHKSLIGFPSSRRRK